MLTEIYEVWIEDVIMFDYIFCKREKKNVLFGIFKNKLEKQAYYTVLNLESNSKLTSKILKPKSFKIKWKKYIFLKRCKINSSS